MTVYVVQVLHRCGHPEDHREQLPATGAREHIRRRKAELRALPCGACKTARRRRRHRTAAP